MKTNIKTSDTHPIYINFVNYFWGEEKAKLGITFAPGKKQPYALSGSWMRDLQKDLQRFKNEYKINTLVSLLQNHEMIDLKIENQIQQCKKQGFQAFNYPIVDNSIPQNQNSFKELVKHIVDQHLKKNKNVVVHCKGGLGRAPTFAASCLIYSGFSAEKAIQMIRECRQNTLDVHSQIQFLKKLDFKK